MIRVKFYFFSFIFLFVFSHIYAQSLKEKELIVEGNNYFIEQKWELAQASYGQALTLRPSSMKANYNMGNLLYEQKLFSKAEPYYQRALKNVETSADKARVLHNLGNNYMKLKKYKEAVETYQQSLLLNPKDNHTRYNYALAKKLLQQKQEENQDKKEELPKPSLFAQKIKAKADSVAEKTKFVEALKILEEGLKKDSTVIHYKSFMNKLNEIIILDSIQ